MNTATDTLLTVGAAVVSTVLAANVTVTIKALILGYTNKAEHMRLVGRVEAESKDTDRQFAELKGWMIQITQKLDELMRTTTQTKK